MDSVRVVTGLLLLAGIAGCAGQRARDCAPLAGPGWTQMLAPPANAADLLALQGMPNDSQTVWFAAGSGKLLACLDAPGLVNPACGGAIAYQFEKANERWVPGGTAMERCNP